MKIFAVEKEDIHKEIDLIQDMIKRMADNSFKIKAWTIGILGAMVTLSEKKLLATCCCNKPEALLLSCALLLPLLCFWYLDAFFLSTEKLYREVYKWVIKNRPQTSEYLFDLNTFTRKAGDTTENLNKRKTMFSML